MDPALRETRYYFAFAVMEQHKCIFLCLTTRAKIKKKFLFWAVAVLFFCYIWMPQSSVLKKEA